jgi:hypothetical protein
MTTTPHPTITAFLRWADLCVAVSGFHVEPVASFLAFRAAQARVHRHAGAMAVEHMNTIMASANAVATGRDATIEKDRGFSFTVGTVAAVLILDGEKSRAYIDAPKALADIFTFSD